jgi:hypothetical protein
MRHGRRGAGDLDNVKVRVFTASGIDTLKGSLEVSKDFDLDPIFGVECLIKKFKLFHSKALGKEAGPKPCQVLPDGGRNHLGKQTEKF